MLLSLPNAALVSGQLRNDLDKLIKVREKFKENLICYNRLKYNILRD